MVRAPDAGFVPKARGYRLEVHITPDGLRHKAGTPLRLKLEVKNVGDRPFVISQADSMMKSRVDKDFYWTFTLTDSSGRTSPIHQPMGFDSGGGRFVGEDEVQGIMRRAERAEVFRGLHVELRPGETLVSFVHDMDYPKDRSPSDANRFVEVSSPWDFRNPGVYTVEAKFRVARWNPVTSTREPAVTFRSNRIRVEVVP